MSELLTKKALAAAMSVSVRTIDRWRRIEGFPRGCNPSGGKNSKLLFSLDEVRAWALTRREEVRA